MMHFFRWIGALACSISLTSYPPLVLAESVLSSSETQALLQGSVEESLLQKTTFDIPASTSASRGSDAYGSYIALQVKPGQIVKNTAVSSELAIDYPYEEGDIVRYSWRMKLPDNFAPDAGNHWWLVARWNSQPNPAMGEKAEDFVGRNPAMMLGYKLANGQDALYLAYGVPDTLSTVNFTLPRGEWVKLTLEVKWSRSNEGWVKLYVNDGKAPYREARGRNMYGKYHNLFRLGSYRSADIQTDATILYGDVRVLTSHP